MIETYLGQKFHWRTMNCWELCRKAWLDLTGQDLPFETPESITSARIKEAVGRALQHCLDKGVLRELSGPAEPSLILFQSRFLMPHGGVLVEGMVLHVTALDEVRHEPLETVMAKGKFTEAKFFTCPSPLRT